MMPTKWENLENDTIRSENSEPRIFNATLLKPFTEIKLNLNYGKSMKNSELKVFLMW